MPPQPTAIGGAFLDFALGAFHTCVVMLSGSVRCFGYNNFGQLGYGTSGSGTEIGDGPGEMPPANVGLGGAAIQVSLGYEFTCAVLASSVKCWGSNWAGQLGVGTTVDQSAPGAAIVLGGLTPAFLASGVYFSCLLSTAGSVHCWGSNSFGQLGIGSTQPVGYAAGQMPPAAVAFGGTAAAVSCGAYHACALRTNGVNPLQCWGLNADGELGVGTLTNIGDGTIVMPPPPVAISAAQVSLGGVYDTASRGTTCAVDLGGALWCFGYNSAGQLGQGNTGSLSSPPSSRISLDGAVHAVAVGGQHVCALLVVGEVQCWGYGGEGQIGTAAGGTSNIGDSSTELPPAQAALPPVLMSSLPATPFPTSAITLVGSGFGLVLGSISVTLNSTSCTVSLVSIVQIVCQPATALVPGLYTAQVTRVGRGTSNSVFFHVVPDTATRTRTQTASKTRSATRFTRTKTIQSRTRTRTKRTRTRTRTRTRSVRTRTRSRTRSVRTRTRTRSKRTKTRTRSKKTRTRTRTQTRTRSHRTRTRTRTLTRRTRTRTPSRTRSSTRTTSSTRQIYPYVVGDIVPIGLPFFPLVLTRNTEYAPFMNVSSVLTASLGCGLSLNFSSFIIELGYDFVSIYDGVDGTAPRILHHSGSTTPSTVFTSQRSAFVVFQSDLSVQFSGFVLWATQVCPATPSPSPAYTVIGSPVSSLPATLRSSDVGFYDPNINLTTVVTNPNPLCGVVVNFNFLNVGSGDFLRINEGDTQLGVFTDRNTLPTPILSLSSSVTLQFTTDDSFQLTGFLITLSSGCTRDFVSENVVGWSGVVTTQHPYSDNTNQSMSFESVRGDCGLSFTFLQFDLETDFDFLYFFDGPNFSDYELRSALTGSNLPDTLFSSGASAGLRFLSDYSTSGLGFVFLVDQVCPPVRPSASTFLIGEIVPPSLTQSFDLLASFSSQYTFSASTRSSVFYLGAPDKQWKITPRLLKLQPNDVLTVYNDISDPQNVVVVWTDTTVEISPVLSSSRTIVVELSVTGPTDVESGFHLIGEPVVPKFGTVPTSFAGNVTAQAPFTDPTTVQEFFTEVGCVIELVFFALQLSPGDSLIVSEYSPLAELRGFMPPPVRFIGTTFSLSFSSPNPGNTNSVFQFSVKSFCPHLLSLEPTAVSYGDTLTMFGEEFYVGLSAGIHGVLCESVTVVSTSEMLCVVPDILPGQYSAHLSFSNTHWQTESAPLVYNAHTSLSNIMISQGGSSVCLLAGLSFCWGEHPKGTNESPTAGVGVLFRGLDSQDAPFRPDEFGDRYFSSMCVGQSSTDDGPYYCAVVLASGNVVCWGQGAKGQLGQGSTDSTGVAPGEYAAIPEIFLGGPVKKLVCGLSDAVCALLYSGEIKCWGNNGIGQLGLGYEDVNNIGDEPNEMPPTSVQFTTTASATDIACIYDSCCVLFDDRTVECWGTSGVSSLEPVPLDLNAAATGIAIAISDAITYPCAFLETNRVQCWGDTYEILAGGEYQTIQSLWGSRSLCIISVVGKMICFLEEASASFGIGTPTPYFGSIIHQPTDDLTPSILGSDFAAVQVTAGYNEKCALSAIGEVRCFGQKTSGALGLCERPLSNTDQYYYLGDDLNELPPPSAKLLPVAVAVEPAAARCGAIITLYGIGFSESMNSVLDVRVSGVDCPITRRSALHIECTLPWMLPGQQRIAVFVSGVAGVHLRFEVLPEPGFGSLTIAEYHGATVCVISSNPAVVYCYGLDTLMDAEDTGTPWSARLTNLGNVKSLAIGSSGFCLVLSNRTGRCGADRLSAPYWSRLSLENVTEVHEDSDWFYFVGENWSFIEATIIVKIADNVNFDYIWLNNTVPVNFSGQIVTMGSIAGGGCIATISQEIWCWETQAVENATTLTSIPTRRVATLLAPAIALSRVVGSVCVLFPSYEIICWGSNNEGLNGNVVDSGEVIYSPNLSALDLGRYFPQSMVGVRTLPQRVTSAYDSGSRCALASGESICWGNNYFGLMALGTNNLVGDDCRDFPLARSIFDTTTATGIAQIQLGQRTACVLLSSGDVRCAGLSRNGILGTSAADSSVGEIVGDRPSELPPTSMELPPTVMSITPNFVRPAEILTILGTGFTGTGNPKVSVGGIDCQIRWRNLFYIHCLVLSVSPGIAAVVVDAGYGGSLPASVTVLPAGDPLVLGISPSSGAAGIQVVIDVIGAFFVAETTVHFFARDGDHNPSTCGATCGIGTVTAVSAVDRTVTVTVPVLPEGVVYDVVVETLGGVSQPPYSTSQFLYCTGKCGVCVAAGTAFGSSCLRCQEDAGYVFNLNGTDCVRADSCGAREILSARTGALRCSCNQTAGELLNLDSSACVLSCALLGEYPDTGAVNRICRSCDDSCSQCVGSTPETCTACPAGVALTVLGVAGVQYGTCAVCRPSFNSAVVPGRCICPPGTRYDENSNLCVPCEGNTFNPNFLDPLEPDSRTCLACPALTEITSNGTTPQRQAVSECVCLPSFRLDPQATDGSCTCAPGTLFSAFSGRCQECPVDSYKETYSANPTDQCELCADLGQYLSTNRTLGRNSSSACVCPVSMVLDPQGSGNCVCPPGTLLERATTLCRPCPADTFSSTFGTNTTCASCAAALGDDRRTTRGATGTNSTAGCICPATLVPDPATDKCACSPGQYLDGLSGLCRLCPKDTYSSSYNTDISCTSCDPTRTTREVPGRTSADYCVCQAGFFPSADGSKCLECALLGESATCSGASGFTVGNSNVSIISTAGIEVEIGYWFTMDRQYLPASAPGVPGAKTGAEEQLWFTIVKCPVRDGCPGGSEKAENCAEGYTGPACGLCQDGFGKLGQQCAKCPSAAVSNFLAFLIVVFVVGACWAVVHFSLPENLASDNSDSLGIKIAVAHLQILGFTGNFATQWPQVLIRVFAVPTAGATVSSASDNTAIDCATQTSLVTHGILIFVTPVLIVAGVVLFASLHAAVRGKWDGLGGRIKQSVLILLYVAHPGIVQGVLKLMVCVDVGVQSLARNDMSVSCKDPAFVGLRGVGIAYLLVYGLGGIVLLFALTKQQPENFLFLTQGYKKDRYFWDMVVTLRQLVLVAISLFASAPLQLFLTTWALLGSWMMQNRLAPYEKVLPAKMDTASLLVLLITVTVGSLFYNGVIDSTGVGGLLVSLFLIVINFGTIVVLVVLTLGAGVEIILHDAKAKKQGKETEIQLSFLT
eukprot:TRINITY_DN1553_c0_g1_i5.p1 TRINITY_DN1553_c0_g1~~TRINITY_DN1553_c0_g1_i5.p1  ORF type:complete len:3568 (+),score=651.27 TRINITY_DN1553_c0_g1_i5:1173-10706(+)